MLAIMDRENESNLLRDAVLKLEKLLKYAREVFEWNVAKNKTETCLE